ncbi:MAG: aryl-sulfate sulfotransferase [Myxococcales bacterium]|nr:aryl-sulfate sulfotransferase [Myxococcales bacterium]MCB9716676.1 aryl-sulfate sulfotransferase [Myxococcales bacterium]
MLAAVACGDDLPSETQGEGTGDSGDPSSSGASTDAPADSSTGIDPDDGSSGSSGELPPLELEVEAFTYPNQPMVIDLAFSAPDLDLTIAHATDPGVRSGPQLGQPEQTWARVRGLAPQTSHELQWEAMAPDGRSASGSITVDTEDPLPGFRPSFTIEGSGEGYGGYVMFDLLALTPDAPASLFMVDTEGTTRWHIGRMDGVIGPAAVFAGVKVRDDGSLLFIRDYTVFVIDEMGTEQLALGSIELGLPGLHHDVIELPSGNFLALSYTFRDIDYPDIGTTFVAGDLIVEIDPAGAVVWEWDAFDHLDPQRRRAGFEELIFDLETVQNAQDWTHGNGLVYDEASGTILYSTRHQDWLILIDHATGDVQWRLGEEGDFTLTAGSWQYHQHSPQWQDDGTLVVYDNGLGNPDLADPLETSRAVRYAVDTGAMTAAQVWEDGAEDFMAPIAGDVDRLPDGSLLITDSSIDMGIGMIHARVREVDEDAPADPTWSFTTEIGTFIYRCVSSLRLPGETR